MKQYKFYSDNGHGWLAVKRNELNKLGLADKVSSCSYQKGQTVYLEEDCDASLFVTAIKSLNGEFSFDQVTHDGESWIRGLEPYSP